MVSFRKPLPLFLHDSLLFFCNDARQLLIGEVGVTSQHSRVITLIHVLQS